MLAAWFSGSGNRQCIVFSEHLLPLNESACVSSLDYQVHGVGIGIYLTVVNKVFIYKESESWIDSPRRPTEFRCKWNGDGLIPIGMGAVHQFSRNKSRILLNIPSFEESVESPK